MKINEDLIIGNTNQSLKDIIDIISNLNNKFNDYLVTQEFSTTLTVPGTGVKNATFSVGKSGYTAIGVVSAECSDQYITFSGFGISGDTVTIKYSHYGSANKNITSKIRVLYIKK